MLGTASLATPIWLVVLLAVLPPIAAVGGAVASPYFQGRGDHRKWLREKRYDAYVGVNEALNSLSGVWAADADTLDDFAKRVFPSWWKLEDSLAALEVVGPARLSPLSKDLSTATEVIAKFSVNQSNWNTVCAKPPEDWVGAKDFVAARRILQNAFQESLGSKD